jgi:hypothetical protein
MVLTRQRIPHTAPLGFQAGGPRSHTSSRHLDGCWCAPTSRSGTPQGTTSWGATRDLYRPCDARHEGCIELSRTFQLLLSVLFRKRAAAALAAVGAMILSSGLVMLGTAGAANATPGTPHKVWICHATSSDSNPYVAIYVDVASKRYQGHLMHRNSPNKTWNDATLWNGDVYAAGSAKPDLIEGLDDYVTEAYCNASGTTPPPSSTVVTPTVTQSDACGTANDSFTVGGDAAKFTYVATGTPATGVSIAFTALPGFTIGGPNPVALTFTNEACPSTPPTTPATVPPTTPTTAPPVTVPPVTVPPTSAPPATVPPVTDLCPNIPGVQKSLKGYTLTDGQCAKVLGTEVIVPTNHTHKPKPHAQPTVLGTEAIVPTAVDAGLATMPTSSSTTSTRGLLAEGLIGGGMLLLLAGGWLGLGRRRTGAHEA